MSRNSGFNAVQKPSWKILAIGIFLIVLYCLLAATTTIGDTGDIGGGFILLMGLFFTAGGLILAGKDLWDERSGRE